jgi:hypothetical protein
MSASVHSVKTLLGQISRQAYGNFRAADEELCSPRDIFGLVRWEQTCQAWMNVHVLAEKCTDSQTFKRKLFQMYADAIRQYAGTELEPELRQKWYCRKTIYREAFELSCQ